MPQPQEEWVQHASLRHQLFEGMMAMEVQLLLRLVGVAIPMALAYREEEATTARTLEKAAMAIAEAIRQSKKKEFVFALEDTWLERFESASFSLRRG